MATQPSLVRYGSGRYVPTVVGDPGPVPTAYQESKGLNPAMHRRTSSAMTRRSVSRRLALELDEALERAWLDLVQQVRGSGDLDAARALLRFQGALVAFHTRARL